MRHMSFPDLIDNNEKLAFTLASAGHYNILERKTLTTPGLDSVLQL